MAEKKQTPQARYDAKNTRQFVLKLNKKTDADIIEILEGVSNRQGYIKALIRADQGSKVPFKQAMMDLIEKYDL